MLLYFNYINNYTKINKNLQFLKFYLSKTRINMAQTNQQKSNKPLFHLLLGATGLYFSYIFLSILLEKLFNGYYESSVQFNTDGTAVQNKFTSANLIVWLSALSCTIFGQIRRIITKERPNPISIRESFTLGFLFTIGMIGGNFSLLYVSFPTYSIGNNSKYLFVVLIGAFLSRVPHHDNLKLPKHKLYVALLLTLGVILFNVVKFSQSGVQIENDKYPEQWKGYILIIGSVIADAMFCDTQAYCKVVFKPTANHLFVAANFFSFVLSALFDIGTGSFFPGIKFILQHPQCLQQLAVISILQVTGQISIYYIIANFKQHIFPLISTTRKIITIVCSIIIFNHALNHWQWVAVGIVFMGMIIQVYEQVSLGKKANSQKGLALKQSQTQHLSNVSIQIDAEQDTEQQQAIVQKKKKQLIN